MGKSGAETVRVERLVTSFFLVGAALAGACGEGRAATFWARGGGGRMLRWEEAWRAATWDERCFSEASMPGWAGGGEVR